ncbi:MAG: hypothetical protein M1371_10995 [Actinobacteria bacterium]|nr:hypothetical protein [Actinomycetota bacterium]
MLGISGESAKVSCSRYTREGLLIRLKPNYYMLREKWDNLETVQEFELANILQVPSYISLTTALVFYEYTTQVQRNFVESIGIRRTREINIDDAIFNYTRINRGLYFGFEKMENFYIASPEKAFVDAIYLESYGRYRLDISSVDLNKFDLTEINKILSEFPKRMKIRVQDLWKI